MLCSVTQPHSPSGSPRPRCLRKEPCHPPLLPCCSLSCLPSACPVACTSSRYHSSAWAPCPSTEGGNTHKTLHWATPIPSDACEQGSPEMLRVCSAATWLWAQAQPGLMARPKSCCSAARLCSTATLHTRRHSPRTLPRLLPPAALPKQHVRSRLVSRAKPRVRVRLVSHADLLCQGSDPVLVRKQTHCNILGSVALSHPLGKPMLWIGRAGLEVLGHSVTIPLAAQTNTMADTSALNYTLGLHSPITKVTGMSAHTSHSCFSINTSYSRTTQR